MTQTTEERYQAAFTKFMAVDQPTIEQHREFADACWSCAKDNTEHKHIYEEIAASRVALDAKGAMHAYRFEEDGFCTGARFAAIDAAFNDDAVRVITHVIAGAGHAVLSRHYDETPASPTQAAMREVIAYLRQQLRA